MYNMSLSSPFILMCTIVCMHLHAHLSTFRWAVNNAPQTSYLTTRFSPQWGWVRVSSPKFADLPHLEKSLLLVSPHQIFVPHPTKG